MFLLFEVPSASFGCSSLRVIRKPSLALHPLQPCKGSCGVFPAHSACSVRGLLMALQKLQQAGVTTPISQRTKWWLRRVRSLAQDHAACELRPWDVKLGLSDTRLLPCDPREAVRPAGVESQMSVFYCTFPKSSLLPRFQGASPPCLSPLFLGNTANSTGLP